MTTPAKKRKAVHRLPPARHILPAINEKDLFKRVIRSHQLIEKALIRGIAKRLVVPDSLEMGAVPFPLKVNLAIALGMLPAEYGPPLSKINAIRNTFAHNSSAKLNPDRATELWNCVPPRIQQDLKGIFRRRFSLKPTQLVNMVFGIMFLDVRILATLKATEKYQDLPYFKAVSTSIAPPSASPPGSVAPIHASNIFHLMRASGVHSPCIRCTPRSGRCG